MAEMEPYPLRFTPVYKDYIWGGRKIISKYQRPDPRGVCAESWELADRLDGMSVVSNGAWAGHTLRELVQRFGTQLMGSHVHATTFPLLIKLIDASDRLSVQVHPDDAGAQQFGGEAKMEMWYVLDAPPGAALYVGLKPGVDRSWFEAALRTKGVEELLNPVPVEPGDAIFVPGGRVHAITAGCLIFEVQQNSNTTYRVYDWGRIGPNGKPRPLHIREALRVIHWDDTGIAKIEPTRTTAHGDTEVWKLLYTSHFHIERVRLADPCNCRGDQASGNIFFVVSGRLRLEWKGGEEVIPAGSSCLVPAAMPECHLDPVETPTTLLRVTIP